MPIGSQVILIKSLSGLTTPRQLNFSVNLFRTETRPGSNAKDKWFLLPFNYKFRPATGIDGLA